MMTPAGTAATGVGFCYHPKISRISHGYIEGKLWTRCVKCGHTWAPVACLVLAGNHQQYTEFINSKRANPTYTYYDASSASVVGIHADKCVIVGTFLERADSNKLIQAARMRLHSTAEVSLDGYPDWYISSFDTNGHVILKDEYSGLRCNKCKKKTSETWKQGFCAHCCGEKIVVPKKYGLTNGTTLKPTLVRKEGDIWRIPKGDSPMWTEQWGYQGSSKTPYVISHRTENLNGAMTPEGWACSCPSFTRHTPRVDCKHILNVKLKEGLGTAPKAAMKLANVDDKKLAEFEAWQREQAARKAGPAEAGNSKLNLFGSTGRKFR